MASVTKSNNGEGVWQYASTVLLVFLLIGCGTTGERITNLFERSWDKETLNYDISTADLNIFFTGSPERVNLTLSNAEKQSFRALYGEELQEEGVTFYTMVSSYQSRTEASLDRRENIKGYIIPLLESGMKLAVAIQKGAIVDVRTLNLPMTPTLSTFLRQFSKKTLSDSFEFASSLPDPTVIASDDQIRAMAGDFERSRAIAQGVKKALVLVAVLNLR